MKSKKKMAVLIIVLILVAAVGITSIVIVRKRSKTVVKVYSVDLLNSSGWFDDSSQLSGTLTSDYIQEVKADSSKTVKKIYVKKGDKVRKGDVLLKYNVEEQELELQLQKLQIKSSQMEIQRMEKQLKKLKNKKPVSSADSGSAQTTNVSATNQSTVQVVKLGGLVAQSGVTSIKATAMQADLSTADTDEKTEEKTSENTENTESTAQDSTTEEASTEKKDGDSGEGNTEKDTSQKEDTEETEEPDEKAVLYSSITEIDQKHSGEGTKESPYRFLLVKKDGDQATISGSVIQALKGKYATFKEYSSKQDYLDKKDPVHTFSITADTEFEEIDTKKNYTLSQANELKKGGSTDTEKDLKEKITSVDDRDASSQDGSSADKPYIYYLRTGGTVEGSVIKALQNKKYAKFIEFDTEGKEEADSYSFDPDTLFWEKIESDSLYSISRLKALKTKPSYKDLPKSIDDTKDSVKGSGTTADPYIFYLQKSGTIKGSLIKTLIKEKKTARFYEYASEEDYKKSTDGNEKASAQIEISGSTKFDRTLEDGLGYPISALNQYKKNAQNSSKQTADKKIRFKQTRKTVQAGNVYHFYVVTEDGKKINQKNVTWGLEDNISKDTSIVKTSSGVELVVDEGEASSSVTISARVKNVKGISSQTIYKTLQVKGADTSGGGDNSGDDTPIDSGGDDGTDDGDDDEDYTASELQEAISEKESEIAQAKEDLHEAKINYREAKAEVDKATVKATLSGTVTTAHSKGTLPTDGSAAIVVKSADGMYVKTSLSEMALDTVKVGGTLTCTSSDTGEQYEAEVREISDFPTGTSGSTDGTSSNPNSSYYPVVAFIKNADGLSTGEQVEISYNSDSMGTDESSIYLQKAYIRSEDKKSYVYIRDKKTKKLKKKYIKTGTTIYGQYIEVKSGVTKKDYIAFPYGKNLREGVKTKISEDDSEIIY